MTKKKTVPETKKDAKSGGGHSRREREIMAALYKLGKATAAQILEQIPDPPSYTAIRTLLTILEKKGHVRHESDGPRYVYEPKVARGEMGQRAFRNLLKTFYDNSVSDAVAAMLSNEDAAVSTAELDRLEKLIARARKEGR
jgi:predicted transcriptional regulator